RARAGPGQSRRARLKPVGLQEDAAVARRLFRASEASGVTPPHPYLSPGAATERARLAVVEGLRGP
ncbi:MAG: hypothetical protein ACRD1P_08265, partial [Thermoanaerobaculia bacterium]